VNRVALGGEHGGIHETRHQQLALTKAGEQLEIATIDLQAEGTVEERQGRSGIQSQRIPVDVNESIANLHGRVVIETHHRVDTVGGGGRLAPRCDPRLAER